ncbi:hypothetical protein ACROYT_G042199 [Oculina patagonica]
MLLGTRVYLLVVWYYVEIFCSSMASLRERIKYAAIVTHFLAIWHNNYVHRHLRLTIRTNFITRETYTDVLLSCHCAVLLICYMRDNFPNQECRLDLTGADMLEDVWSKNGQWVGNHHNYNFGDLSRNTSHMLRLEQIRVDPNAPKFAKPHPKQESIWGQQYPDCEKVRLNQYPRVGEEVQAWREGIRGAQELARAVGMVPTNGDDDDDDDDDDSDGGDGDGGTYAGGGGSDVNDNDSSTGGGNENIVGDDDDDGSNNDGCVSVETHWFYRPFCYPGNKFNEGHDSASPLNNDLQEIDCADLDANRSSQLVLGDLNYIDDAERTSPAKERHKHNARVTIPERGGEQIYKTILMLNQDPNLSHDRLQRVRQRQEYSRVEGETALQSASVALFEDYAVLDRENKTFRIGNLVRFCAGNRNKSVEYQRPVPYNDPKKQSITTYMQLYSPLQGPDGLEQRGVYELQTSELCAFPFVDVLTHVNVLVREDYRLKFHRRNLHRLRARQQDYFILSQDELEVAELPLNCPARMVLLDYC